VCKPQIAETRRLELDETLIPALAVALTIGTQEQAAARAGVRVGRPWTLTSRR
jgi:hypothetical protein